MSQQIECKAEVIREPRKRQNQLSRRSSAAPKSSISRAADMALPTPSSSSSMAAKPSVVVNKSSSSLTPPPTKSTPAPTIETSQPRQDEKPGQPEVFDDDSEIFDFTKIPHVLDERFLALDIDSALRPTIIKPNFDCWTKKHQPSLLGKPQTLSLRADEQKTEKNRAFDILDAISRSGALDIEDCSLHVVIAATHCFPKSLINTLVQDNVNPIEKVERSLLIVSETVHGVPLEQLVKKDQLERVRTYSSNLFNQTSSE